MKHVFLSSHDVATPLLLEPAEDSLYVLSANAPVISVTLNLTSPGVRAFIVGLFHTTTKQEVNINQTHLVPNTESHVLLKSVVASGGEFCYQGNISLTKDASESIASQEARGLLLGEEARFKAVPSLEILPKSVSCTHKASSAPINPDSLFILTTRGLSESEARKVLETAFLKTALDTLRNLKVPEVIILQIEDTLPNIE